jgi:hypothetical protein
VNELINFAFIPSDSISDLIPDDEYHHNIISSDITIIYCVYCNKYYPPRLLDLADCYSENKESHIERKRIMICKSCIDRYQAIRLYTRPRLVVADKMANDEQAIFDMVVSFIDQGFIIIDDMKEEEEKNDKTVKRRIDLSDINIPINLNDRKLVAKDIDLILFEILKGLYDYDEKIRSLLKDDKYSINNKNKALFKLRYELRQHYKESKPLPP